MSGASRTLPRSLRGAYSAGLVLSLLLGCCSAYSSISIVAHVATTPSDDVYSPDPRWEEMERLQRTFMQIQAVQVTVLVVTAIALGVGCGLGMSGRRIGRPLALGAFTLVALAVVADASFMILSWTRFADVLPVGGADMYAVLVASMLPRGLWILLRLGVVGAAVAALLSPSAREHYANAPAEAARGTRE